MMKHLTQQELDVESTERPGPFMVVVAGPYANQLCRLLDCKVQFDKDDPGLQIRADHLRPATQAEIDAALGDDHVD